MRKVQLAIGVVLLVTGFSCAAANLQVYSQKQKGAPPSESQRSEREAQSAYAIRRQEAITKAQTTDEFEQARKLLAAVMADPLFPSLDNHEQRNVLSAAAWVEVRSGQYAAAAPLYRRALEQDPSNADDWHRLSMAEEINGNDDAAADALIHILQEWPGLANGLEAGNVLSLVDDLPVDSDKRMVLMRSLFDANWKWQEEAASDLWYELALTLVERGEKDQAREVISGVAWPYPLIQMQADRRFDGLVSPEPGYVSTALTQLVGRLEAMSRDNPTHLYVHNAWLEALLHAGRQEQVIAISEDMLARIGAQTQKDPAFYDSDDANFTQEIRFRALRRAGRLEEAEAALKQASEMPEYGEPNIGQKVDLATWYNARLRPDDAIATIERMSAMAEQAPRTRRDVILMQAALHKGDKRVAERLLKQIRTREHGAEGLVLQALLRASRLDDAVALFIRRLQDPRLRDGALLYAQKGLESEPQPGDTIYQRNKQAMLERADVKAAIDAVGRVQSYDVW
jgi:tetratricopeptide (TPR) repeat protein